MEETLLGTFGGRGKRLHKVFAKMIFLDDILHSHRAMYTPYLEQRVPLHTITHIARNIYGQLNEYDKLRNELTAEQLENLHFSMFKMRRRNQLKEYDFLAPVNARSYPEQPHRWMPRAFSEIIGLDTVQYSWLATIWLPRGVPHSQPDTPREN